MEDKKRRHIIIKKTVYTHEGLMRQRTAAYDSRARVESILAPLEIAQGAPYTIRYEYHPEASTPYAQTRHYMGDGQGDVLTYTFIDGLSRPLQVKKTSVIYNELSGADELKLTVSGHVRYDALGRTVAAYLPVAEAPGSETTFNPNISAVTPTRTVYDNKDRAVRVVLPDGAQTTTAFEILSLDGEKVLRQELTDAEGNRSENYSDVRSRSRQTIQRSAGGDVLVRFRYNPLGEVVETIDPKGYSSSFTYDRLGRRLSTEHPDGGLVTYEYDRAGNLLFLQGANLRAMGPGVKISYTYDYERPHEIIYPKNIQQRVTYSYGAPGAGFNRAGRLWLVQDATGAQEFFFDALGNTSKTIRTVMPSTSEVRTYIWGEEYDTWGRIRQMTYPDGEKVSYAYNAAGQLYAMSGQKLGRDYSYIERSSYDLQDRMVFRRMGNGTETRYSYDEVRQRLETMKLVSTKTSTPLMDLSYTYDRVDNILSLRDNGPLPQGREALGGPFRHEYHYDDLYRLVGAEGMHLGPDTASYALQMGYDVMGSPIEKKQQIRQADGSIVDGGQGYSYGNTAQPHAPDYVGNRRMEYDREGNLTAWTDTITNDYRRLLWNEEGQLLGVEDNGYLSRYLYDASGERVVKAHGGMQGVFVNGAPAASIIRAENITVYVSPFITVNGERFTKHYYAGTQRVASKMGAGQFDNRYQSGNPVILAGKVNPVERYNFIESGKKEYLQRLGIPPGPPTMKGIYGEPEFTGEAIPDSGTPVGSAPKGWPRQPVFAPPGGPPGAPIQYGPEITNETALPGLGFASTGHVEELDLFFYHSDHLGSTAYITDRRGIVSQFIVYLPFGEALVDRHTAPEVLPYKFNAKEKDAETGLYYYGARYYNDRDLLWLGVDPLWEKYPNVSPYVYCLNNPVRLIDPTGMGPTDEEAASISAHVYGDQSDGILMGGWKPSGRQFKDVRYNDKETGLNSALYERTVDGKTEYVYAFAGTADAQDIKTDLAQILGPCSQYDLAVQNAEKINEVLAKEKSELSFTGHSLGGGLAAASAYAVGGSAQTFNAAGLSPFSLAKYGKNSNNAKIDAYIMITDPLNFVQTIASSGIMSANGRIHVIFPKDAQAVINGHSIDNFTKPDPKGFSDYLRDLLNGMNQAVSRVISNSMR